MQCQRAAHLNVNVELLQVQEKGIPLNEGQQKVGVTLHAPR